MRKSWLVLALLCGCGGTDATSLASPGVDASVDVMPEVSTQICEPGRQASCACVGGAQGAQRCDDDGARWGDCACPDASVQDTGKDAQIDTQAQDVACNCPNGICRNGQCCEGCWDGTQCHAVVDGTYCGGGGNLCKQCSDNDDNTIDYCQFNECAHKPCGAKGQDCCASGCVGELSCKLGVCVGCGLESEACCDGSLCASLLICDIKHGGICVKCGEENQPCCGSGMCNGFKCVGGYCVK